MFKCVQMCLNMLKICSNVLILAGLSCYGWMYGGNGCFLVVMVIMSAYGVNTFVFWGCKWLWVFVVVFGWLNLVLGG